MKNCLWRAGVGAVTGALSLVVATSVSAQVNCGAARSPAMYRWCLQQQQKIYEQEAEAYNDIARQQYLEHQRIGQGLQYYGQMRGYGSPDGTIARWGAKAWNAPRYYYNYRYGEPTE